MDSGVVSSHAGVASFHTRVVSSHLGVVSSGPSFVTEGEASEMFPERRLERAWWTSRVPSTFLNLKTTTLHNVQWFRGGLVLKARRLLYHSTLGLRVIKKKEEVPSAAERRGDNLKGFSGLQT